MDTRTLPPMTPEATLDIDRALQFLGGDAEVLGELLLTFMQEAPAELAAFETAVARQDRAALLRYLHRLVPTVAIIGTPSLHEQARTLYHAMQESSSPLLAHLPASRALAGRMHALLEAIRRQLSR